MVGSKKLIVYALIITLALFGLIYSFNAYLNQQREDVVLDRMEEILDEYQEIQALSMMTTTFGSDIACLSLENSLSLLDKTLWDTGLKIDRYREATEQFANDPFYVNQKRKFNRNEVIYLSMITEMQKHCDFNQTVILFFFQKKEECPDCDAQSFVLTDVNKEIDNEIAIFSFDADLDLPSIKTLKEYFAIDRFPCVVVDNMPYCGLKNRQQINEILCSKRPHSICSE